MYEKTRYLFLFYSAFYDIIKVCFYEKGYLEHIQYDLYIDFLQYKFKGERFAEYIKNSERGIAQHMIGFQVQNLDDVKLNLMHYITKAPTYIIINIIENDDSDNEDSFQNTINVIMQMFTDSLKNLKGGVIAFADLKIGRGMTVVHRLRAE